MKLTKSQIYGLFLGALLLAGNVHAQKSSIKFSHQETLQDGSRLKSLDQQYTEDEDYVYSRSMKGNDLKKIVIAKVSKKNGKTVWEKTLPVEAYNRRDNSYFSDLAKVADGFILFVKKEDSKLDESYLTAQKLDENFKLIGDEKTVATSKAIDKGNSMYFFFVHHVGKYFLLRGIYQGIVHHYKNEPYKFTVIDENLQTVWEEDAILPKDKYFSPMSCKLDAEGNLLALFTISTNGKKINDPKATIEHCINYYNVQHAKLDAQTISLGTQFKYFNDFRTEIDTAANELVICGTYHRTKRNEGSEGLFVTRLDLSSFKTLKTKLFPFPANVIEQLVGANAASKGGLPKEIKIAEIFNSPEEQTTFILEEFSSYTNQGPNSTQSTTQYSHGKIVILQTNEGGTISWSKLIPRSASGNYSILPYCLFYAFRFNNVIYTVFNAEESTVLHPEKMGGYVFMSNASDMNNLLVLHGYDERNGNLVESKTFSPGASAQMTCNISSIRQLTPASLGLVFEKTNVLGKITDRTQAILEVE